MVIRSRIFDVLGEILHAQGGQRPLSSCPGTHYSLVPVTSMSYQIHTIREVDLCQYACHCPLENSWRRLY